MAPRTNGRAAIRPGRFVLKWHWAWTMLLGFVATPVVLVAYSVAVTAILDRDFDEWADHDAAFEMTRALFVSIDHFRRDQMRVPSEQEGLEILTPKYLQTIPLDPWGNRFIYRTQGGDWGDVVSLGADGRAGGRGPASDVSARYGSPGTAPARSLVQALIALLMAIPALAYAASFVRPSLAPAVAGIAVFWAWVVAATVAPNADASPALAGAFAAIVAALFGTVLTVRQLRGGATWALAGAFGCLIATAAMMG